MCVCVNWMRFHVDARRAMQSATCTMQAVDHRHVIRANRPQLSKQAGVCSDSPIVDDVGVVSDCAHSDSSDAGCEPGCRISTEVNIPINGITQLHGYIVVCIACRMSLCGLVACLNSIEFAYER